MACNNFFFTSEQTKRCNWWSFQNVHGALLLFCFGLDNNQAGDVEAFISASRYLDNLLNSDTPYYEQMVRHVYPTEPQ